MNELKESIINAVKFNCDVSDARSWGYFSICGLLMSLRGLYMSENDLEPWARIDREDISKWIAQREAYWRELENEDFRDLNIRGKKYDPFDVVTINCALKGEGLVYGAGYGLFKKPSFFLADLHSSSEIYDCTIYLAKKEYAKDLFSSPGMHQGRQVFLRLVPLKKLLWDKFLDLKANKNSRLEYAFSQYGFSADQSVDDEFERKFDEVTHKCSDIILYHELGEIMEDFPNWSEMVLGVDTKDAELFLRTIKDLLSDTSDYGPLKRSIDERDKGGLSLCVALAERYRIKIYPEIKKAFEKFVYNEDWSLIEEARGTVYVRLVSLRDEITEAYRNRKEKNDFIKKITELQSELK
ncbi:MAG: hypothetical protein IBX64_10795 [Actinobacteria bacterium]|nr:hypothetical protein [Actinomycetota bacterium]